MSFDPSAAGWFVLDVCVRAALAAAGVALVLRLLRVRAAAVRHAAWTLVLIAMLLMPLLASVVPALPLPLPIAAPVAITTSDEPTPRGISHPISSPATAATVTVTVMDGRPGRSSRIHGPRSVQRRQLDGCRPD